MDLNKGFILNKEIKMLGNLIKLKMELAEKITSSSSEIKVYGKSDKIERAITEKVMLEKKQLELIQELNSWKKKLIEKIDKIDCTNVNGYIYKVLLEERYINFRSWNDISLILNLSVTHVRGYLKLKAIEALCST